MKSKRNTVWIVLTCMLAVLVFVLSAALYRSWKITEALQTQLAEMQNGVFAVEVVQGQQETATAGDVQTVRVMNGILQQQDTDGQWVDVAPVEELTQADPILAGRNKMQELIAQNKEAVQNGTISAEQISPLLAKQSSIEEMALEFASQVQSEAEKKAAQTAKTTTKKAAAVTTAATPAAPAATPVPTQQPTMNNDNGSSSGGGSSNSDSGSSSGGGSGDNGSSGGGSDSSSGDSGSSGGGSDSSSGDSGSSGGGSDSGSGDSGSSGGGSDSGSTDSGDGEDVGWTDEIL